MGFVVDVSPLPVKPSKASLQSSLPWISGVSRVFVAKKTSRFHPSNHRITKNGTAVDAWHNSVATSDQLLLLEFGFFV